MWDSRFPLAKGQRPSQTHIIRLQGKGLTRLKSKTNKKNMELSLVDHLIFNHRGEK